MKKQFFYKADVYHFLVELNVSAERRPGGERQHKVTVKKEGADWTYQKLISDTKIKEEIADIEKLCMQQTDGPVPDPTVETFLSLGFA